ncbi:hypothetical protein METSCH_C04370 [Metschnikowia aff. pulcherrima]|uniref:Uncharacterized protein n=1 Tax=Metschnikowia aff. pulcherrima TaxID=2163413 RepID=A0A4P6XNJ5_9ASCO|nr:hypothetical protein METSCH_C04370 [Metschnikowia aff. pulcherrima]
MYAAVTSKTSLLTLGYLTVSTMVPFMLSYKETQSNHAYTKGYISARSLFNKI